MADEASAHVLVPVGESPTLRNTVAYAVQTARERAEETGETAIVHFVYPAVWRAVEPTRAEKFERAEELLDRVELWAKEDLAGDEEAEDRAAEPVIDVETAIVGDEDYLFSPADFARVIVAYANEHDLDRIVVDPEYQPGGNAPMLRPLEFELSRSDLYVEEAPVERPARRGVLVGRESLSQYLIVFGTSYLFYLTLGGFSGTFDLVTGAISAGIVTLVLGQISLKGRPDLKRIPGEFGRMLLYIPYLVWEIAKANVTLAYVILHPRLPIDPKMVQFRAAVWNDLPATTLANSITLTPGTLTVEVSQREFYIHSLTRSARRDLLEGALERAVRFVFYGRAAARIPSPREREAEREDQQSTQQDAPTATAAGEEGEE
ncbi:multicomponent Na+:H+ antiporter subunit E [Halogranum amylolyticum]|uniref:Multicomponent Na+:H+ antiporter subunit E n=1 Tax=Halogranum amylolyticum TaxID=660520 RepID=A0A1H8P6B8_9EURY|nr:monovalent cation/H+ antiporter subunit E [Halogranum amylolyticum]SEO37426.1 multicomponent Na+:H+ antiporter subunit E [Halogranum amylolyticum]